MKKIKQHLEEAFQLVSSVPVKGDAVDVMAAVRVNLRTAYRLLEEKEEAFEPSNRHTTNHADEKTD